MIIHARAGITLHHIYITNQYIMADNRFMRHPGYNSCLWSRRATTGEIAMEEDTNDDNDTNTSTAEHEMLISNNHVDDTANGNLGGAALITDESNRSLEESLDDSIHSVASDISFYEAVSTDLAAKSGATTVEEMNKQAEEARQQLETIMGITYP